MHNNWKDHLGISVSELCFKNALGLLINNRSNFHEERIIVRKIAVTFRGEQIIVRKFRVNHRAKRIIIRKIARIKTIGVTKMRGNFVEISFQAKFLRKAGNSSKFVCITFAQYCTTLDVLSWKFPPRPRSMLEIPMQSMHTNFWEEGGIFSNI